MFWIESICFTERFTGYAWNNILYTGGDTMFNGNTDSDYHATKYVLTLMEDLLHEGHCVYINNWYTSIEVCNVLKNNTIDAIGTLR